MVYALDVTYCARCRIGTVDEQGLCSLCGAPQRPPSALGRLAEASSWLPCCSRRCWPLLALGALLLLAAVSSAGVSPPRGSRRPPGAFSPQATLAARVRTR